MPVFQNRAFTYIQSQERTGPADFEVIENAVAKGAQVILNITDIDPSQSVQLVIEGRDPASGAFYELLTGAPQTAEGVTRLTVHPTVTPVANVSVNDQLPLQWRIRPVHATLTDNVTYSVGVNLLL